jgi:hypothetical protein
MQEQLAAVIESLESAQSQLRKLTDGLSEAEWRKRPGPGRWSAAECVEHLNITSRAYLPLLRDALARARELKRPPHKRYRRDARGWFMSTVIAPRRGWGRFRPRVKTTPSFVPGPGRSRDEVLSEFVKLQAELISVTRAGDGLPLDEVKIVEPFVGRSKYNAYSALVVVERHEHRHIQQAEEAALLKDGNA